MEKKLKKDKSKSKLRLANMSCHTYDKKEHWISECPKKKESKTEQTKSSSFAHIINKLSRNWKVRKMLMAICNGYKIRQVNMASIINTIDGVLLDYTAISYIFSE